MPAVHASCAVRLLTLVLPVTAATPATVPRLAVGALTAEVVIDGRPDEAAYASAPLSGALTQVDPREGAAPSASTRVRVLAGPKAIVVGIECDQPAGTAIVSYSVRRDAVLSSEDHVRIVLDPFLDGRYAQLTWWLAGCTTARSTSTSGRAPGI